MIGVSFKIKVKVAWFEPAQFPFTWTVIIYVLYAVKLIWGYWLFELVPPTNE